MSGTIPKGGTLVPSDPSFGIAKATDLIGGSGQFTNAAAIGAIAAGRLVAGQLAYDISTGIQYQLVNTTPSGGFANGTWTPVVIPSGGSWTPGVKTVATTNIPLTGEQTINGFTTSTSRVLVVGQTLSQNDGLYTTAVGAWTRTSDANTAGAFALGKQVAVLAGSLAGTIYVCNVVPTVLGTDPIGFVANTTGTTFNAASPPAIGWVAANTGAFTDLIANTLGGDPSAGTPLSYGIANIALSTTAHTLNVIEITALFLRFSGSPGGTCTITMPTPPGGYSPFYVVSNNSDQSILLKAATGAGVTLAAGSKAVIHFNGTDYVTPWNPDSPIVGSGADAFANGTTNLNISATSVVTGSATTHPSASGNSSCTTTDATTPVLLATIPIPASGIVDLGMSVVGLDLSGAAGASTGDFYRADFMTTALRVGAAAPTITPSSPAAGNVQSSNGVNGGTPAVTFVISSPNVLVKVTGPAVKTWHWSLTPQTQQVT